MFDKYTLDSNNTNSKLKSGYMVHWRSRVLIGKRDIKPGLITFLREGGFTLSFEHAIPIGKELGIEFYVNLEDIKHRIRVKAKVTYCELMSNNAGALLSLKTTMIDHKDNHTLNNVLHVFGNSSEINLKQ